MLAFKYPYFLFLLVVIPFMIYWHFKVDKKRKGALKYSNLSLIKGIDGSYRILFRHAVSFLRVLVVALIILAIARPQAGKSFEEITTKGVEIVMLLDVSGSMKAEDFKPKNRLAVSKKVMANFVKGRKHDKIGLIAFAGNAFTMCPLTTDYDMLLNMLAGINFKTVDEDGTAIGTALATASNRLRESKSKSKIIILLTDGANNKGEIDPTTAAKAASALGIKIYAIGVGKDGDIPYPIEDPFYGKRYQTIKSDLDEGMLTAIATETKGKYFRAHNPKSLKKIYKVINDMEKTEIKSKTYTTYSEMFTPLILLALFLLFLEILLANTVFRRIP